MLCAFAEMGEDLRRAMRHRRVVDPSDGHDLQPQLLSAILLSASDGLPARVEPRYTHEQR